MKKYLEQVRRQVGKLQAKFVQILREENEKADRLTKAASAKHMLIPNKILSFIQPTPLIDDVGLQEIDSGSDWTTPIVSYLKNNTLTNGKEAARKLKVQVVQFILIKDVLYKRGFSCPYLRCLSPEEAAYVMREVHEGIWKNHLRLRSLVHKLIRARYYKGFCSQLGIKNHYSSPAHPQANRQVKVMNQSLLKIIQDSARGGKGYMARRIAKCTIGIQNNSQNAYDWHTEARQSFQLRLDSQATEWETMMRARMMKLCTCSLTWWLRSE